MRHASRFGGLGAQLFELIWPSPCVGCGTPAPEPLCEACHAALRPNVGPRCPRCDEATLGGPCARCGPKGLRPRPAARRHALRQARGPFLLTGPLHAAILRGKHHGEARVWPYLAALVAHDDEARALAAERHALVPVPLARARRFSRGYNPSALMAQTLGRAWQLPVRHLLRHVGQGGPQSLRAARDRAQAMVGAFVPLGARLPGLEVLLVDDVLTTGATLEAAARALLDHGAQAVAGVVLARRTEVRSAPPDFEL